MYTTAQYIKTYVLAILLFFETLLLTNLIVNFVMSQNYFNLSTVFAVEVVLLMFLSIVTYSLTIGAWGKWIQYVIIPLPVSCAIFLSLVRFNFYNALTITAVVYLLLCYDVYKAVKLKDLLIKFDPSYILRISTRGLLFIFSVLGGLVLVLNTTYTPNVLNVGEKIAELTDKPIRQMYNVQHLDINLKDVIERQVNDVIAPYKNFINPIMAVLMFGLFRILGSVADFIFTSTINPIFDLAKRTRFFKTEKVMVEKEILKF